MEQSEGDMSLKNPVTPPGVDPRTIRLVAQCLNHYTTPGHNKQLCTTYDQNTCYVYVFGHLSDKHSNSTNISLLGRDITSNSINITVFLDVTPCCLVGISYLHGTLSKFLQTLIPPKLHNITLQKTISFVSAAADANLRNMHSLYS
jgi:hypothetical protein